jgi:hypothetical protein
MAEQLSKSIVTAELKGCTSERPFRSWVGERTRDWVVANYGGDLAVRIEPSEGGVFPVKAFGTSFWPDVSVESPGTRAFLAVEVKCLKRRGLPGHVAQALGQALLYKVEYLGAVVVFVLVEPLEASSVRGIAETLVGFHIESAFVEACK